MLKHREYFGHYTRSIEKIHINGYVVNTEHLQRLERTINESDLFKSEELSSEHLEIVYYAFTEDGNLKQINNFNDLVNYPNTFPDIIDGLRVECHSSDGRKIEIEFNNSGVIIIDVYGRVSEKLCKWVILKD